MRRFAQFGGFTALALCLIGCHCPERARLRGRETISEIRMGVLDIEDKREFLTSVPVKAVVQWKTGDGPTARYHKYEALILPLDAGRPAEWSFEPSDPDSAFNWPGLQIRSGWLYLVGEMPLAKSEHVIAAAEGSQLVFKVEANDLTSKTRAHVIFLDGSRAKIKYGKHRHEIGTKKRYREYLDGVPDGEVKDLSAALDIKDFIQREIAPFAILTKTESPKAW